MPSSDFQRQSARDKAFDIANACVLGLVLLSVLLPLWFVIVASVSDSFEVSAGRVFLLPRGFSLNGYRMIFRDPSIWTGYRNTIFYTLLGTAINVSFTTMAAYPLSRRDWVGRQFFMGVLLVTMFFSGGIIPTYLLMNGLGLINTVWAMVIPGAVSVSNTIVMRTYFVSSIPNELTEAAMVDGCSNTRLLLRVVLPLSKPILAVMALFYGVAHWNAFFGALIYITKSSMYPLQLVLRTLLIQNQFSQDMLSELDTIADQHMAVEQLKFGLIIVSTLPMMLAYPFLQRFFIKGVMIGALKG